ncbi:hypothetical protein Droror1_Dr00015080 [Drosera rotundifolia]
MTILQLYSNSVPPSAEISPEKQTLPTVPPGHPSSPNLFIPPAPSSPPLLSPPPPSPPLHSPPPPPSVRMETLAAPTPRPRPPPPPPPQPPRPFPSRDDLWSQPATFTLMKASANHRLREQPPSVSFVQMQEVRIGYWVSEAVEIEES